jgi:hypothetical protein
MDPRIGGIEKHMRRVEIWKGSLSPFDETNFDMSFGYRATILCISGFTIVRIIGVNPKK